MATTVYMQEPARINLQAKRGADATLVLDFYDEEGGELVDVTGYTFEAKIRVRQADDYADSVTTFTVDDADAASGSITLSLTDTQTLDTETLPAGRALWWECWRTEPDGAKRPTAQGTFTLDP